MSDPERTSEVQVGGIAPGSINDIDWTPHGPKSYYVLRNLSADLLKNLPPDHPARIADSIALKAKDNDALKPFIALLNADQEQDPETADKIFGQAIHDIQVYNEKVEATLPAGGAVPVVQRPFDSIPNAKGLGITEIIYGDGAPTFVNWGQDVVFSPSHVLVVTKIAGVTEVIVWAGQNKKKVRMAGFRHTWSELYGSEGDVVMMFLPEPTLTKLPYKDPPKDFVNKSELIGIDLVDTVAGRAPPPGHSFCRVKAGTTNGMFREWCWNQKAWCIPFNVIMLEVTFGGVNAPICHGSGFSSSTISDLVVEIEYIDHKGQRQVVNDPVELRVASGAFGLLGVVISVTLQLDVNDVTEMMPRKQPVYLAIPPPPGYDIPEAIRKEMKKKHITVDGPEMQKARLDFIKRCENDYYLEWFWFPYRMDVWINTWQKRAVRPGETGIKEYPGDDWFNGAKAQEVQETAVQILVESWPFQHLLNGRQQALVLGTGAMLLLPDIKDPSKAIKTYVSEGLHFRRGIQNFRCWDMEWELEVPANTDGSRDYEGIQRAWWDGISAVYADKTYATRIALEMRLTGSSGVVLAPQRGNTKGTTSIEVLTILDTERPVWDKFCQTLCDKWTSYKDRNGNLLKARPHWAKQWKGLTVRGKPIERYFTEDAYKQAFSEFRSGFTNVVSNHNGDVNATLARFGDPTMKRLIFGA